MSTAAQRAISEWFDAQGWEVFDFQREAWEAFAAGESGLIHSPTGSGKTLAAWLGPLTTFGATTGGLRVLWITPLRALANDTAVSLRDATAALGSDWRVEIRTGDTSSSARQKQRKTPPEALITTPESLSVLLSYADGGKLFRHLDAVIVDEWHELIGSKRGVQLELCLARLRLLRPKLRVWGLSATLANLGQAMSVLCPQQTAPRLIAGSADKNTEVRSIMPPGLERFPWSGHLGLGLIEPVIEQIERANSTLVFTNTRSQSELWFEALMQTRPDWVGRIALHHGSVDRGLRKKIETALKAGELIAVICTSSLDLGVDFAPVDQVLQVGSPKGVARLMQRAGRSGHQPGAISTVWCVPTYAMELVEVAAARHAWSERLIEARSPQKLALDVLVQHMVTLALGGAFEAQALLAEIRGTFAFADLSDDQWQWCLDFVTRGGQALAGYPQYQRVVQDETGIYRMTDRRLSRQHRLGIGTISSDTTMRIQWLAGGSLGHIEESFVSRLAKGDRFLFAGRLVELVQIRDMVAYVRRAKRGKKTVPRWQGGRMPLSNELAHSMQAVLAKYTEGENTHPELELLAPLLDHQARVSEIPTTGMLLIERCKTREGHSIFVYPFGGRLVHEGLATLMAWRIARDTPATFTLSVNDYGFELLSPDPVSIDESTLRNWLSERALIDDLVAGVNLSESAKRQFRDIARIAGLVFQGYPGAGKSARQVQASSGLIYDVLSQYDENNLLLAQAQREVLDAQLESQRMRMALQRIDRSQFRIVQTERLSPFAFPLWAERLQSQIMSTESWKDRVQRMAERLNSAAQRGRRSA